MICPICKTGHLTAGKTTVTLSRGNTIVVLKEVPADVCDNCGEYYLAESTADKTFAAAESAVIDLSINHDITTAKLETSTR